MNSNLAISLLMILSLIFYSTKLFIEGDWMASVFLIVGFLLGMLIGVIIMNRIRETKSFNWR